MMMFAAKDKTYRFDDDYDLLIICPNWLEKWADQQAKATMGSETLKDENLKRWSSLKKYKVRLRSSGSTIPFPHMDQIKGGRSEDLLHYGCSAFTFLHEMSHSLKTLSGGLHSTLYLHHIFQ